MIAYIFITLLIVLGAFLIVSFIVNERRATFEGGVLSENRGVRPSKIGRLLIFSLLFIMGAAFVYRWVVCPINQFLGNRENSNGTAESRATANSKTEQTVTVSTQILQNIELQSRDLYSQRDNHNANKLRFVLPNEFDKE